MTPSEPLVAALETALARLAAQGVRPAHPPSQGPLLDVMGAAMSALSARPMPPGPTPVRLLHHFAASGGTLISRAVAALPNTLMMSEIDPFSTLSRDQDNHPFHPGDLLADLHRDPRAPGRDDLVSGVFLSGLYRLWQGAQAAGRHLVLRDHAHSQFCGQAAPGSRPTLHQIVANHMPLRAVITVRHPMDTFLSMQANGWLTFAPATLEEFARRHLRFLEAHDGLPVHRYEAFVADPTATLASIATDLALPFDPDFELLMPLFALSGDSGRRGWRIAPRPRRVISEALHLEAAQSPAYKQLCARLGYTPTHPDSPADEGTSP